MPSFSEVYTWTNSEIIDQIIALLPEGWQFNKTSKGIFSATIINDSDVAVWEDRQLDERLLLLNAFGWLFSNKTSVSNPIWNRGDAPEGPVRVGMVDLPGVEIKDPEDVDPEEVASVYEAYRSQ